MKLLIIILLYLTTCLAIGHPFKRRHFLRWSCPLISLPVLVLYWYFTKELRESTQLKQWLKFTYNIQCSQ